MTVRTSRLVSAMSLAAVLLAGGLTLSLGSSATAQPTGDRPAQPGGQPGGRPEGRPERGPGGPEGRREGGSVDAGMKMMNRAVRQLGSQITDAAKKDDNLKLIGDMQRGCVVAKNLPVPADVLSHAKDDAEKAKLSKTFRSDLIKLMRALLDLEELVIDGKTAEAKAKLDEVVKMKDAGHNAMGLKE